MNSKKEKLKGKVEHRSLLPCFGNAKVYTDMNKPLQYLQLSGNDGQEGKLTDNCEVASLTC